MGVHLVHPSNQKFFISTPVLSSGVLPSYGYAIQRNASVLAVSQSFPDTAARTKVVPLSGVTTVARQLCERVQKSCSCLVSPQRRGSCAARTKGVPLSGVTTVTRQLCERVQKSCSCLVTPQWRGSCAVRMKSVPLSGVTTVARQLWGVTVQKFTYVQPSPV